jgi:biotin synthase-related radical SAM superfamily protein
MDNNQYHSDFREITKKKAELIKHGSIYVPTSMKLPYRMSRSTAGPGAGGRAIALSFGGTRVKMGVSRNEDNLFSLVGDFPEYTIKKKDEIFLKDVTIIPTLLHAPNQAFVNIYDECIFDCKFCATPRLGERKGKERTPEKCVDMILKAAESEDFESVAITSGVSGSVEETNQDILEVVRKVEGDLKDVDIGVETYITKPSQIEELKKAGTTEIKINIESFNRDIFERVCPDLDYDLIMDSLKHAVEIFGKGKVMTNIIIGLGESDEDVEEALEHFAIMGIIPIIRSLRENELNQEVLKEALGHELEKVTTDRMLKLASKEKEILEKYGLSTRTFETMCHKCGCCDIVPFWDV